MKAKALFVVFFSILIFSCQSNSNFLRKDLLIGYYNVAEEYFALKKYDKAVEYYKKCLVEKDPEMNRSIQYQLAKCYFHLGKYDEALKFYNELLALDPQNTNIRVSIGYCYIKLNDFEKAENLYKSLVEEQVNNQSVYKNLILLYVLKGDFENSEKFIANYKNLFPQDDSISEIEKELTAAKNEKEKKASEEAGEQTAEKSL